MKLILETRKLLWENINRSTKDLCELLRAAFPELLEKKIESTVATVRSDWISSIDFLKSVDAFNKTAPTAEKKTKKAKKQSRGDRWHAAASDAMTALSELIDIQSEYQDWRDGLPENLQSSSVGEKLETVCNIDLPSALSSAEEANEADLPLGFGRD